MSVKIKGKVTRLIPKDPVNNVRIERVFFRPLADQDLSLVPGEARAGTHELWVDDKIEGKKLGDTVEYEF